MNPKPSIQPSSACEFALIVYKNCVTYLKSLNVHKRFIFFYLHIFWLKNSKILPIFGLINDKMIFCLVTNSKTHQFQQSKISEKKNTPKRSDLQYLSELHIRCIPYLLDYRIYSAIRRGFHLSRMTTNNLTSSM